ncbi:MAG: nucleotidyl transferase AbiEii/AbiGii toxin family protein [Lachnospiraceae bacterium]|nr:nucleotidyl transferase AbiEii/AbiGii toxin family protein [Lachnospiraceae bacterium]
MISLDEMTEKYRNIGYSDRNADARVCQDIVLKAIERSNFGRNVTIKGGVVMRSITGNVRRATEDLDLDFIRYSLRDESIRYFISKLNCLDGIKIEIKGGRIEPLSQQEYNGKRVYIIIKDDNGNSIESKIDLGVQANMSIEQDTYCFDVCVDDEGASLLINSCEQIFAEKLKSLLRFGPLSTRYKDIFDLCYLKEHVEMTRLAECIKVYIIDEPSMRERDMNGIQKRVDTTFSNRRFRNNVENSGDRNWLQMDVGAAFKMIQEFLKTVDL